MCEKYNLEISEIERKNPSLLHAKLGAYLAKDKYDIEDEEILMAIRSHTTGRPGMSLLEKIVYIADYMEPGRKELPATIAWMDDEPLVAGRTYWALHGHRWVKAKVRRVVHRLNINTLAEEDATQLEPNAIGHVELLLQEALPAAPFAQARVLGSLILVDTASHKPAAAVLVN